MSNTTTLIAALENSPGVIIPLIREVPPQYLKRRPSPTKWSAYQQAEETIGGGLAANGSA